MPRIDGEIVIGLPVDVAFDYVDDQSNESQYNPQIVRAEQITPGSAGQGIRFRSTVGSMQECAVIDRLPKCRADSARMAAAAPGRPDHDHARRWVQRRRRHCCQRRAGLAVAAVVPGNRDQGGEHHAGRRPLPLAALVPEITIGGIGAILPSSARRNVPSDALEFRKEWVQ